MRKHLLVVDPLSSNAYLNSRLDALGFGLVVLKTLDIPKPFQFDPAMFAAVVTSCAVTRSGTSMRSRPWEFR